ncbi:5916_t:CDS:2, partial [Paraglomus brasilianum]
MNASGNVRYLIYDAVNTSASLDDGEIIQEVLDCKSAESDFDTEDEEKDTVVKKISVNE